MKLKTAQAMELIAPVVDLIRRAVDSAHLRSEKDVTADAKSAMSGRTNSNLRRDLIKQELRRYEAALRASGATPPFSIVEVEQTYYLATEAVLIAFNQAATDGGRCCTKTSRRRALEDPQELLPGIPELPRLVCVYESCPLLQTVTMLQILYYGAPGEIEWRLDILSSSTVTQATIEDTQELALEPRVRRKSNRRTGEASGT